MPTTARPKPRQAFQALFWLAIATVLWLTLSPADRLPPVPFNLWDKAQHALAFAILALIGLMAWPARAAHLRLYLGLCLLGAAIEAAQHFSGLRHGDLADWVADLAGLGAVAALRLVWR